MEHDPESSHAAMQLSHILTVLLPSPYNVRSKDNEEEISLDFKCHCHEKQ